MSEVVTIRNLVMNFENQYALNNINLSINEGEIFGLLGPSGAGKTTMIKILTGQLKKTDGFCKVFNTETNQLGDHIGILFQGKLVEYGTPKELCIKYKENLSLHVELTNGSYVDLSNKECDIQQLTNLLRENMVVTVHSQEPSLEKIFILLTGRKWG